MPLSNVGKSSSSDNNLKAQVCGKDFIGDELQIGCKLAGAGIEGGSTPQAVQIAFLTPRCSSGKLFLREAIVVEVRTKPRIINGIAFAGESAKRLIIKKTIRPQAHSMAFAPMKVQGSFKPCKTSPPSNCMLYVPPCISSQF